MRTFLYLFILSAVAVVPCSGVSTTRTEVVNQSPQTTATSLPNDQKDAHKAVIKSKPEPERSNSTGTREIIARVVLRMVLQANGKVTDISVMEVTPGDLPEKDRKLFIKKSTEAAKKIKFEPAMKDGRRVSQWVKIEYKFETY